MYKPLQSYLPQYGTTHCNIRLSNLSVTEEKTVYMKFEYVFFHFWRLTRFDMIDIIWTRLLKYCFDIIAF